MILFGKKKHSAFNKDEILEDIKSAEQKCLRIQKRFSAKSATENSEDNARLALSCRQCADKLEECAELVSHMLPPRDKHKAKNFEIKAQKLLTEIAESLQESENFDYPIKNGTVESNVNDLKSLLLEITNI